MPLPPFLLLTTLLGQTPQAPPPARASSGPADARAEEPASPAAETPTGLPATPTSIAPQTAAPASAPRVVPRIIPRSEWDDEPPTLAGVTRYRGKLRERLDWIVVHHSSFLEPPGPAGLVQYHRQVYGWADVGYHFIIAVDGRIYAGRDVGAMGAHAGQTREANRWVVAVRNGRAEGTVDRARRLDPDYGAIGVVLDGYYPWEIEPPPEQLAALRWLLGELRRRYAVAADHVITHREVRARIVEAAGRTFVGDDTTCPGSGLQAVIDRWRAADRETGGAR